MKMKTKMETLEKMMLARASAAVLSREYQSGRRGRAVSDARVGAVVRVDGRPNHMVVTLKDIKEEWWKDPKPLEVDIYLVKVKEIDEDVWFFKRQSELWDVKARVVPQGIRLDYKRFTKEPYETVDYTIIPPIWTYPSLIAEYFITLSSESMQNYQEVKETMPVLYI